MAHRIARGLFGPGLSAAQLRRLQDLYETEWPERAEAVYGRALQVRLVASTLGAAVAAVGAALVGAWVQSSPPESEIGMPVFGVLLLAVGLGGTVGLLRGAVQLNDELTEYLMSRRPER